MHEFSIAEQLVRAVLAELDALGTPPPRLKSCRVVVGGLRQIVPESLQLAYSLLTRDTAAAGSALELTELPVLVACRECQWQGEVKPPVFLCAECGSAALDVRQGMELYLASLEIEDERQDDSRLPRPDGGERAVGGPDA